MMQMSRQLWYLSRFRIVLHVLDGPFEFVITRQMHDVQLVKPLLEHNAQEVHVYRMSIAMGRTSQAEAEAPGDDKLRHDSGASELGALSCDRCGRILDILAASGIHVHEDDMDKTKAYSWLRRNSCVPCLCRLALCLCSPWSRLGSSLHGSGYEKPVGWR